MKDDRKSPRIIAELVYWSHSPVRVGSVITLKSQHTHMPYVVERRVAEVLDVIPEDRRKPWRTTVNMSEVKQHLTRKYIVGDGMKILAPRKWGVEPPGNCMLVERDTHPGRASRLLPEEIARAMGADIKGVPPEHINLLVADGLHETLRHQITKRAVLRARVIRAKLPEFRLDHVACPILALPASPELRHPTAKPDAAPLLARNVPVKNASDCTYCSDTLKSESFATQQKH